MHKKISLLAGSIVLAFSAGAQAQTKWDRPAPTRRATSTSRT